MILLKLMIRKSGESKNMGQSIGARWRLHLRLKLEIGPSGILDASTSKRHSYVQININFLHDFRMFYILSEKNSEYSIWKSTVFKS